MSRKILSSIEVKGSLFLEGSSAMSSAATRFVTQDSSTYALKYRSASQMLSDIGAAASSINLDTILTNGNTTTKTMTVGSLVVSNSVTLSSLSTGVLKINGSGVVYSENSDTAEVIDYDTDIIGSRDGNNTTFQLKYPYLPGSLKLYLNGLCLTMGTNYDYIESYPSSVVFSIAPQTGSLIVAEYKTGPGNVIGGTGMVLTGSSVVYDNRDARVMSLSTAVSITPDLALYDQYIIYSLSSNITINASTGTSGSSCLIWIKDNGTPRTITLNANYVDLFGLVPATTTVGKWTVIGFFKRAEDAGKDHIISANTQS